MLRLATCLFFLGFSVSLFAQNRPDSTRLSDPLNDLDTQIEDVIIGNELEEQADFTYLTDALRDFQENPLDLNRASREEFLELPGATALLYSLLQDHIRAFGKLTSLYELQAVEGFDLTTIRSMQPFVVVKDISATDLSPGVMHPAGPSLRRVAEGMEFEFIQRFVWQVEEQRGYTAPDTALLPILDDDGMLVGQDTALSSRFAGSPYRSYTRLRARYNKNVSFAITGEKDPGEAFRWDPENRYYGYDFLSGHVAIANYGRLKNLVVGDYNISVGQGLVLSRGLGFGKSAAVINTVKMPSVGIRPYASVNENQFLRGAAATYAFDRVYVTGFYSRLRLDASVQDRDTLTNDALLASGIQISGLHRTPSEIANRRAVRETAYGGRVEYRGSTLTIGTTHYVQQYDTELNRPLNSYNQFDFRGDLNYLNAVDFDWVKANFNFFGEVARSRSGGMGGVVGFMSSLSSTVDVSLVARHFDIDFHTNKAFVFAERPTAAQNETGVYLGLRIAPNPKWTFSSYFDQFRFAWNKFRTDFPSKGWEFLTQLEYRPKRGTSIYTRFRSDNRERNAELFSDGQQLNYLIGTRRNQWRIQFQTNINRNLQYRTRMEFSWYKQGEEERQKGFLLYQDLAWKWGYKWKLTGRYALFDVSDFEARIFAYENDVLGFFTIPPYFNRGSRYYLILNYKPTRRVQLWLRIAQTRLRDVCSLERPAFVTAANPGEEFLVCTQGSGLTAINSPNRTEIKFQLMWRFGGR